jgi:phosphoribosyl 1,2-cyclic phosphodiesterase
VRVLFCGVRGSTSAPGAEFVRVGGHTSCVALAHDGQPWTLALDAGTGIRRITDHLGGRAFVGSVVLTHLHWDHVQGLPFFAAGDRDDARVRVVMPDQTDADGRALEPVNVLALAMSPPHFPIGPDGLRGDWTFESVKPGNHRIEGFDIVAFDVPHKGGRTYGYRVSDGTSSIAYIPDHCPQLETTPAIARECADVDLLLHDAQFLEHERAVADLYGHATVGDAVDLARRSRASRLALFHHSPARRDDEVDAIGTAAIETGADLGVEVIVAHEEDVIDLRV